MKKIYHFNKDTLQYSKVEIWPYITAVIVLIILWVVLSSFSPVETKILYLESEENIELKLDTNFSEEAFIEEVKRYNFKYPEIIIAQARIESNNFKSPIFKECNNIFGMKEARKRLNLAEGSCRGHAYYSSWKASLQDRALYEASYTHKIGSRDQYITYLDRLYAEDGSYAEKLLKALR